MATATIAQDQRDAASANDVWQGIRVWVLKPLGSLKITCLLLTISMFLVFVGSLAQARRDVWMVVGEYFRCWVAWVQLKDLMPPSLFPTWIGYDWEGLGIWQSFPYPGGWMIGTAMCINLLAAHLNRIKIQVKGKRLILGLVALMVACGLTGLIIDAGNSAGLQSEPLLGYGAVWTLVLGSLGAVCAGALALTVGPFAASGNGRWLWASVALISGSTLVYFLVGGEEARLSNESMRIMWQLLEGSIAASALLIACSLLFRKRAGIVVLHLGIVMLMYSEWQVARFGRENQVTLTEGETSTFLRDIRERELAIVSRDGDESQVWVIPESALKDAHRSEEIISNEVLPFPIRVREFYVNSELKTLDSAAEVPKASGLGAIAMAVEQQPRTGMDELPDISSVYFDIVDESGDTVSTHLVSQEASELRGEFAERIEYKDKSYDLFLRSMRTYRPWTVKLLDVSRTNYIGTSTPKDFRSTFVITDEKGEEHEFTTWMNNPVRFGGETFYQQGYQNIPGTGEVTTLQVVKNTGWMLPYIGCMVVAFGMFAQFGQSLIRFLNKQARTATDQEAKSPEMLNSAESVATDWLGIAVPVVIVLAMAGWILGKAAPRGVPSDVMNLQEFAKTPVTAGGRIQPIQTYAKNALLPIMGKSTFTGEMEPDEIDEVREDVIERLGKVWENENWTEILADFNGTYPQWIDRVVEVTEAKEQFVDEAVRDLMTKKRPATWWLLDVITRPEVARRHRVYRITDDQLLALLNLEKRPGFSYAAIEFEDKLDDVRDIYNAAHEHLMKEEAAQLTPLERRVHTLVDDHSKVGFIRQVFNTQQQLDGDSESQESPFDTLVGTWRLMKLLEGRQVTLCVPTGSDNQTLAWESGIAADSLSRSQDVLDALDVVDPEKAVEALLDSLPRETVLETLRMTVQMLSTEERRADPGLSAEALAENVRERAASARDSAQLSAEPYLQKVMGLIGASDPGATPQEMIADMTAEDLREFTSDRPAPGALTVLEVLEQTDDHRSGELRARLRQKMAAGEDLNAALEREAVQLVVEDLNQRAGHILFVANRSESVLALADQSVQNIFAAWKAGDADAFNTHIAEYQEWLGSTEIPFLSTDVNVLGVFSVNRIRYESFINRFAPDYYTIFLYLFAMILGFLSWLGWKKPLWRSAMGVTVVAFLVHTFYLYARMQISGRPPVTNLYSSAVFIGWVVVLVAFIVECFFRLGHINIIGCISGASTLCMAWFIGIDEGDTLSVMQAVLDTQFWLATHVVCVTIGYAATFVAGLISLYYCSNAIAYPKSVHGKRMAFLGKVIYGVTCFALFFSFVGTVLGGLWADDSWGRFWGWDPKENGALLIVIWNSLILHARWDKMIKDYGTAVLAIAGNAVTAWSWFGVNELGAGLHKYGFTEGRAKYLAIFILANLLLMVIAIVVRAVSKPADNEPAAT